MKNTFHCDPSLINKGVFMRKKLFNYLGIIGAMMFAVQAWAVSESEALKIGLDYSLNHSETLKAHPSELKPFTYWASNPQDSFKILVENGSWNNSYHCEFYVMVDAKSGEVLTSNHLGSTSTEWSCEFLADYGGGT